MENRGEKNAWRRGARVWACCWRCSQPASPGPRIRRRANLLPVLPRQNFRREKAKFTANCAACHGSRGVGTKQGPPLVHKIYEPNHHADVAFQRAAENGVRAHHWEFGNMPKIEGVTAGGCRPDHSICPLAATRGGDLLAAPPGSSAVRLLSAGWHAYSSHLV